MTRVLMSILLLTVVCAAQAEVVIDDRFNDPKSGWPDFNAASDKDVGFAVYANGKYQMTPVKNRAYGLIKAPRRASGGDVRITSAFFMYAGLGAGGGGLVCRMQDLDNFYAFIVVGSGQWRIARVQRGEIAVLGDGSVGNQVMAGAVDAQMTAECRGDQLTLSLGGRRVGQVRDTAFANGEAGLFVAGEQAAGTSVSFDDYKLESLN
jgi:hypothetical protein